MSRRLLNLAERSGRRDRDYTPYSPCLTMVLRRVGVSVDESPWRSRRVPDRFKPWIGTQDLDVDAALLFVALYTRPPVVRGFSLADTWAWLRKLHRQVDTAKVDSTGASGLGRNVSGARAARAPAPA